ncbi:kelch-like protein [Corallococcus sp. AB050B]|nr:kelch-like protein [Corallococcus sp. AB050B]
MRTERRSGMAVLALGLVLALAGCGSSQAVVGAPEGSAQVVLTVPQALSASDVVRVELTVSGTGMTTRTDALVKTGGQWGGVLGQLPAGTGRIFSAQAFDASNTVRYAGQVAPVTIQAGQTTAVTLLLQEVNAPAPFDNAAPRILSLVASPGTVAPGGQVTLQATAEDPNTGDSLTYAWTAPSGSFSAPSSLTSVWTAPAAAGQVVLTLTVTDSKGASASLGVTITVSTGNGSAAVNVAFNTWPQVTRVTALPSSVDVGQATQVTASASDADGDSLSYQWMADCAGTWTNAASATVSFTPSAQPAGGTCTLTVTVHDGWGGQGEGSLGIHVGPPTTAQFPPEVVETFQSVTTVPAGATVVLRVRARDPQGSALTFAWTANVGTLSVPASGSTTSEVVWTPPACVPAGVSPSITATVANAIGGTASTSFSLSIPAVGMCPPPSVCGDGITNGSEACDDGNTTSESSCPYGQASCTRCNSTCTAVLNLQGGVCGDGVRNGPEVCDDGNTVTESACPGGQASCSTCNSTCTAEFHSLSAAVVGTGLGSVSSAPAGLNCPSVKCTALFARGTSVTLTAIPANNSTFLGWSGGGCGSAGGCTVAMTQATNVTAEFKAPAATAIGIALAASELHSIALRQDGTVWACGDNDFGQLGDGTTVQRVSPVQVSGLAGITAVSARWMHSAALRQDGTVWGWGNNVQGQLGDGTAITRFTPVQVQGLTDSTAIATGLYHSLALRADGTVWAWGNNGMGQLGDGTNTQRLLPVQVKGLTQVTAITAGLHFSLALRSDGSVWAWGYNSNGQLGDGTTTARRLPIEVPNLTGITTLAAGWRHSLALRSDGTVWAWGDNASGQLGDTSVTERHSPVRVVGASSITAMAGGNRHSLAVRSDGTVWAWGNNSVGQLGDGTDTDRRSPVRLTGIAGATSVYADWTHSLALRQDGTVWGWGSNAFGQLGDGTTSLRLTPARSLLPSGN